MRPSICSARGIPAFWRIELGPIRAHRYAIDPGAAVGTIGCRELDRPVDRLVADEPVPLDVALHDLLPGWAR